MNPRQRWVIEREGRIVTSGNMVGMNEAKLNRMAETFQGQWRYTDAPAPKAVVGPILGHTWEQIKAKQQGEKLL